MSLLNVKANSTTIHEPETLAAARIWLARYLADIGATPEKQVRARGLCEGDTMVHAKVNYWIERF